MKHINALDLIPVRQHPFDKDKDKDNRVTVRVPKFRNKTMARLFLPRRKPPFFSIHLDELGSAVWLSIDGEKNVQEICDELSERLGEKIEPVEERIPAFISKLYQERYVLFRQIME